MRGSLSVWAIISTWEIGDSIPISSVSGPRYFHGAWKLIRRATCKTNCLLSRISLLSQAVREGSLRKPRSRVGITPSAGDAAAIMPGIG